MRYILINGARAGIHIFEILEKIYEIYIDTPFLLRDLRLEKWKAYFSG